MQPELRRRQTLRAFSPGVSTDPSCTVTSVTKATDTGCMEASAAAAAAVAAAAIDTSTAADSAFAAAEAAAEADAAVAEAAFDTPPQPPLL